MLFDDIKAMDKAAEWVATTKLTWVPDWLWAPVWLWAIRRDYH